MAKYQIPNSNCLFGWNMKELTDMKLAEFMDQYNENAIWLVEIVEKSRNEITKHSNRTAEALPQMTKTPSAKRNRRRVLQKLDPLGAINENIIADDAALENIEPRQPIVTIKARSVSPPSAAPVSVTVSNPVTTISPPVTVTAPPEPVIAAPILALTQTKSRDASPAGVKRRSQTRLADKETHEPSNKRSRELDDAESEEANDVVVIPPSTTLPMPRNKPMFGSAGRLAATMCTPLVTNTVSASSAGSGSGSHRVLSNICTSSFLPRITPNQPSLKETEDKKRLMLAEKEDKAEQTRLRKQQLMLAKADEQRRMREERHKLAAMKRQEQEKQVAELTVKTMAKKFDTMATSTAKIVDEKTEKQKLREKRLNDAQQRRKQEEEARRLRTEQLEFERRRMEELAQKRREVEEQERQRKVAELKRQEEERREEIERERQREAERLRHELELKEREEAEKKRLREERERQERLEKERQEMEKQMERARQKKAEEDRRKEEERQKLKEREAEKDNLRAAQQEQKHLQALIDKHNAQLALNKNNAVTTAASTSTALSSLQAKVGLLPTKPVPVAVSQTTVVPATASLFSKIVNPTAAVVKSPPATARVLPTLVHTENNNRATMTLSTATVLPPSVKPTVPAEPFTNYISRAMLREDNYDISGIRSDDSTDDESEPKRRIPPWAQGGQLRAALASQTLSPPDIDIIFANLLEPLDLNAIFRKKKARFNQRTSSGCWSSPMYKPSGKGYAISSSTSKLDEAT